MRQYTIIGLGSLLLATLLGAFSYYYASSGQPNSVVPNRNVQVIVYSKDLPDIPPQVSATLMLQNAPLSFDEFLASEADAILIDQSTLVEAQTDPQLKSTLRSIALSEKILFVYNSSAAEIVRTLEIHVGVATSSGQSKITVGSIGLVNGIPAPGEIIFDIASTSGNEAVAEYIIESVERYQNGLSLVDDGSGNPTNGAYPPPYPYPYPYPYP